MTAHDPEKLGRMSMHVETYDFGASEAKPVYRPGWWMFAAAVLLWLLLTLAIVAVL